MYKNGFNKKKVMETIRKGNQGEQAYANGDCRYRTGIDDQENRCLVGCFIPDDIYTYKMEDKDAYDVIGEFDLENIMPMNTKAMQELQNFHDQELDVIEGEEFFKAIEEHLTFMEENER